MAPCQDGEQNGCPDETTPGVLLECAGSTDLQSASVHHGLLYMMHLLLIGFKHSSSKKSFLGQTGVIPGVV
jgi:hypothetical protein